MKNLAKRLTLFIVGFALGCLIALAPGYVATVWHVPACTEGCPTWLQTLSFPIYLMTPFAGGIVLTSSISFRHKVFVLLCLTLVITALVWLAYAHQIGLLRQIGAHI